MIRRYKLGCQLVIQLLLIVIFLESCHNNNIHFHLQPEKEIKTSSSHLTIQQAACHAFVEKENLLDRLQGVSSGEQPFKNQPSIKQLIGREFTAAGGHLVTFDEQGGKLRAGVIINTPKGFSKTYTNLPVSIAKDIAQLTHLNS